MEIRNVKNVSPINYPKENNISKDDLTRNIPTIWRKFGITSLVISLIMKYELKSNATDTITIGAEAIKPTYYNVEADISGAMTSMTYWPGATIVITQIVLLAISFFIFLKITISTIKAKIKKEKYKPKKITVVCLILFFILAFAIGIIRKIISQYFL